MNYTIDHCEPFDQQKNNIWMKLEHCGRYLFARDICKEYGLQKVLDIACAEGYGSQLMEEYGISVYGADINPEYIQHARERCNGVFRVFDIDHDPWPDEYKDLDAVICFETIEHVTRPERLLQGISEALKPSGMLVLSVPNSIYEKTDEAGNNYDPYHVNIFSAAQTEQMIKDSAFEYSAPYGQSLCNRMYIEEKAAIERGALTSEAIDALFDYERESIIAMSELYGYPNKEMVNESYSYIFKLKKATV